MNTRNNGPKFDMGQLACSRLALETLSQSDIHDALVCYARGDWGDLLCSHDKRLNDEAILNGDRILAKYKSEGGEDFYIETNAVGDDGRREATVIYLCEEY